MGDHVSISITSQFKNKIFLFYNVCIILNYRHFSLSHYKPEGMCVNDQTSLLDLTV